MVAARAELAPVADQLVLSGTATARRISLISPATEGLVENTLVDAGDHVNAGQVLARLDQVIASHELATAEAALAEGVARLRDAERRRDEAAQVHAKNLIAETTYESAVAEASILEASVRKLKAEYERQREIVDRHTVRAPFPGVVARKLAEVGQWVQRGDALFDLVDTDVLRVDVPVPQNYYSLMTAGTPASVRFDAVPNEPIDTTVSTRVTVGDPAARTFLVRIEIDNRQLRFAPGMSARVVLRPGARGGEMALQVPRDALTRLEDGSYQLWLIDSQSSPATVQPVTVQVQRFTGRSAVIAPGAVKDGDSVVVRGNENLRPGQTVRPVEPAS